VTGSGEIGIRAVPGLPEITGGLDLGKAICAALPADDGLSGQDILAISQKVVSKAEGRTISLASVTPGSEAVSLAGRTGKDPRMCELILDESRSLVRVDGPRGIVITETRHGFVCANAGIDSSNAGSGDTVILLPEDPDASARRIREQIATACGVRPAVIVTDSFGRAWRLGQSEVAIGCAGIEPLDDWRGRTDSDGRELAATVIATADQVAAASDLARDKTSRTPAVVVSGLGHLVTADDGPGSDPQLRPPGEDLFR
jgi:coenzyme F420-0:L-glutamate ligase / coenzyme F420-1:gamma-L-glutamate ligase